MVVTKAKETLLDFLRDEGQEPSSLEPSRTWRAFRRFMNVPVAGVEEDAMLYEYIAASLGGPGRFIRTSVPPQSGRSRSHTGSLTGRTPRRRGQRYRRWTAKTRTS